MSILKATLSFMRSHLLFLLAHLIPPLVFRALLLGEMDAEPGWADIRGVFSDIMFTSVYCLLTGIMLWPTTRVRRFPLKNILAVFVVVTWTLLHWANYEHLRALGSVLNLRNAGYLGDKTFFLGSALSVTHPLLLALSIIGTSLMIWWSLPLSSTRKRTVITGGVCAVALLVCLVWTVRDDLASWRQKHFIQKNIEWLIHQPTTMTPDGKSFTDVAGLTSGDLTGTPIEELGQRRSNVLLVILEGISGAYIESLRKYHGAHESISMPRLDEFARRNIRLPVFIANQRQTNRGEYALLCGELPKLLSNTPKTTEIAGFDGTRYPCLPGLLSDWGYQTVYLQAAPLEFMLKECFLPKIGFSRVLGVNWFRHAYQRGYWGVDDRTLFEGAVRLVNELQSQSQPWLLTLLTVGTHHPFPLPDDFTCAHPQNGFRCAVEYLDLALDAFLTELENTGVLDNTVVLITSDESMGFRRSADDITNFLGQAWSLMIVRLPDRLQMQIDEPYMQMDVSISVLDLMQFPRTEERVDGRSFFRQYAKPRPVVFANNNMALVGAFLPGDILHVCDESFRLCRTRHVPKGKPFAFSREAVITSEKSTEWLRQVANHSLLLISATAEHEEIHLASTVKSVKIPADVPSFHSGQYLHLPPGYRLQIGLQMELQGKEGFAEIEHFLDSSRPRKIMYSKRIRLTVGQKVSIRYAYTSDQLLQIVNVGIRSRKVHGHELTLRVDKCDIVRSKPAKGRNHHPHSKLEELEYSIY
jgi:hypothetical protein